MKTEAQIEHLVAVARMRPRPVRVLPIAEDIRNACEQYFQREPLIELRLSTRIRYARALWRLGWGRDMAFSAYLETIPRIPYALLLQDTQFNHLVLVDKRRCFRAVCQQFRISIPPVEHWIRPRPEFPFRDVLETPMVYWMRCQDGERNRGRGIIDCVDWFSSDEGGLNAFEGMCLYAEHAAVRKSIAAGFCLDLPGSRSWWSEEYIACLGVVDQQTRFLWVRQTFQNDGSVWCGVASRRLER